MQAKGAIQNKNEIEDKETCSKSQNGGKPFDQGQSTTINQSPWKS